VGLFLDAQLHGDVSQPEALVVMHLRAHGPSTINDVHRAFLHRRSTLTSVLDRLESRGLVRRGSAPSDRRSVLLELTPAGARAAAAIARAYETLRRDVESSAPVRAHEVVRLRALAEAASARARDGTPAVRRPPSGAIRP
jgi:DNA-binding MarR family transcriptional regulator